MFALLFEIILYYNLHIHQSFKSDSLHIFIRIIKIFDQLYVFAALILLLLLSQGHFSVMLNWFVIL